MDPAAEQPAGRPNDVTARFATGDSDDLAPSGAVAKTRANLAAIAVLRDLDAHPRPATRDEQAVLARWSGWGSLPGVFDPADDRWSEVRDELRVLLDNDAWRAAERTVLNAHYTRLDLARVVWDAVRGLGFSGGRVLEPGCGAGTFFTAAPADVPLELVGVELDPTTAAIARELHPHAAIHGGGFQDVTFADASFDLAIGNVPFAKIALHDPRHNTARHSIHNHFLIKSLHLVRPGGLVACFTSRWTLDARNPRARNDMATLGELVTAVRLPDGAFRAVAGTDVIIDLVVLRRHDTEPPFEGSAWTRTVDMDVAGGAVAVNEIFVAHPEWVLGDIACDRGRYHDHDLRVRARPDPPLAEQLAATLAEVADHTRKVATPPPRQPTAPRASEAMSVGKAVLEEWHSEGSLLSTPTGGFMRRRGGQLEPYAPQPSKDRDELRALIAVRDTLMRLLAVEATTFDDAATSPLRSELTDHYERYASRWGPLNRFSLARTGRTDPTSGEPSYRRLRPAMGGFRADPGFPAVCALEDFDPDTGIAHKASIFEHRVVAPRTPRTRAHDPHDALALCLDQRGVPDLGVIAQLLETSVDDARRQLDAMVFDDPATGKLVAATSYLSGDVREKLRAAREAAAADPVWQVNVDALEAVQPVDILPDEIDARLGVSWISPDDHAAFIRDLLSCNVSVEYHPFNATWAFRAPGGARSSVAMTSEWGTDRADALHLIEAACNQRAITIYDETDDGTRTVNIAATIAAREKQEAVGERFAGWVWEGTERTDRLTRAYNERFNSLVLPMYDGSHLTLPGLSRAFGPHDHQRNAIWRICSEPTVLLAHAVGAGKTATMVIAGIELRRLGLANKPAYIVPNHMLEQFSGEFLQLYPQARLLIAGRDDLTPAHRKSFVARCATGDWDAIIITASAFERIPVSSDTRERFLNTRIEAYRDAIATSRKGDGLTVKRLQAQLAREEERHKRLLAQQRKDDGVTFEATGIDYLFVDEAHLYKNLGFTSRIQGVGGTGSQRAEDLALKLDHLRRTRGERIATFATATPIANSIAEMYVMQTYLQPDTLQQAGIEAFDAWAAAFGRTITALELAPDGATYRMHSRFARFANVPELLRIFRSVADVRSTDQLHLPIPDLTGDGPRTIVVPASADLRAYVNDLADRAEHVRNRSVQPEEDNMLKISGDGRRAALHLRLVDRPADDDGKLEVAADSIHNIWQLHRHNQYLTAANAPALWPGALQLVFCDLGTPKPGEWSVYQQLRDLLTERGIPAEQIAFIHDARDDKRKAELFAACRDGRIAVLVGSTDKMGIGTNVQARAVALHHLDCPWRPADLEQREGRILRQGNQNDRVDITRYVTEHSFDIYMWQTLERKAAFIHQIMRGDTTTRTIDDIGEQALSYAEVKALATGNPLILERAGVHAEVTKLHRLRDAHRHDQHRLQQTAATSRDRAARHNALADRYEGAIRRRIDTRADQFTMVINSARYADRAEVREILHTSVIRYVNEPHAPRKLLLGDIGGFDIVLTSNSLGNHYELALDTIPEPVHRGDRSSFNELSAAGMLSRLEHRLHTLERHRDEHRERAQQAEHETAQAERGLTRTFPHGERITFLQERLAQIDAALLPADNAATTIDTPPADEPHAHDARNSEPPSSVAAILDDWCQTASTPTTISPPTLT